MVESTGTKTETENEKTLFFWYNNCQQNVGRLIFETEPQPENPTAVTPTQRHRCYDTKASKYQEKKRNWREKKKRKKRRGKKNDTPMIPTNLP